jgi:hypothetical protein
MKNPSSFSLPWDSYLQHAEEPQEIHEGKLHSCRKSLTLDVATCLADLFPLAGKWKDLWQNDPLDVADFKAGLDDLHGKGAPGQKLSPAQVRKSFTENCGPIACWI